MNPLFYSLSDLSTIQENRKSRKRMDGWDDWRFLYLLKHIGNLQEESMALCSRLPEPGCSFLISELNQAKRRLKPVNKKHLNIVFIDGRVHLIKDFEEEVRSKIIGRAKNVYPSAFLLRIRIEYHAAQ